MTKISVIFLILLSTVTWAAEDPVRVHVAAAIADARAQLRSEILAARVVPGLNVDLFLQQAQATDALDSVIDRAQQIGGPRWIDDQTCQVKLEVSGERVAYALISAAAIHPRQSPVPAAALEQRLADMKQRTFTGTGTAVAANKVSTLRPADPSGVWLSVTDQDRERAVDAARRDAARQILDDIRPIQVDGGKTIGDLLERDSVQQAVDSWIASRPVTQVKFQDDLSVQLTVAAPPQDLLDTVVNSARAVPGYEMPLDARSMEQLKQEFARRVSAAVGRGGVSAAPATAPVQRVDLPDQPPRWVWSGILDAEGAAPRDPLPLRTKTKAEKAAGDALRQRIGALAITPTMTVDQAAKLDPRLDAAIGRIMLRTRVSNVQWLADGGVRVRLYIDPADLWSEMRSSTGN